MTGLTEKGKMRKVMQIGMGKKSQNRGEKNEVRKTGCVCGMGDLGVCVYSVIVMRGHSLQ